MKIEVVVASEKHLSYVTAINDAIDHAAKARGTGIARRTNEYIADKIRSGKAIIALNREEFVGFCYIESWGHQKFVANSGLIVVPAYRGLGVAKQIKEAAFHLSRRRFPQAKLFGLSTGEQVMRINTSLGYVPRQQAAAKKAAKGRSLPLFKHLRHVVGSTLAVCGLPVSRSAMKHTANL